MKKTINERADDLVEGLLGGSIECIKVKYKKRCFAFLNSGSNQGIVVLMSGYSRRLIPAEAWILFAAALDANVPIEIE